MKFCSCSDDTTVKVWDFARCHEERSLTGNVFLVDEHMILIVVPILGGFFFSRAILYTRWEEGWPIIYSTEWDDPSSIHLNKLK